VPVSSRARRLRREEAEDLVVGSKVSSKVSEALLLRREEAEDLAAPAASAIVLFSTCFTSTSKASKVHVTTLHGRESCNKGTRESRLRYKCVRSVSICTLVPVTQQVN
jgi:hypothetical protein